MSVLLDLIDQLDLAVAVAEGVASGDEIESAADTARRIRLRRGFIGDELVVAIAGGTGSGKSSVLNALAGEEVVTVSPVRPHTDVPLAWIPDASGPGLLALLDDLAITERVGHAELPRLALVDLPDVDSVISRHRRTVEGLLSRVDGVLWVFDPSKYADPLVHEEFLAPLSSYRDQFLFALNQVDTVSIEDVPLLRSHLTALLEADGFSSPQIFVTAADPDVGEPQGIDELKAHLEHRLDAKRVARGKLVEDVRRAAMTLATSARLWESAPGSAGRTPHPEDAVGPVVAERLREAPDPASAERVLWDRAYLGATVAGIGVACAAARCRLEEGGEW